MSLVPTMPGSKPRGWFSRRHKTDDANRAARERYANRSALRYNGIRGQQVWTEVDRTQSNEIVMGWAKV